MKILVAGAGIGGLTAALCLQKSGHDVTVFEQAKTFSETGAGIQCGANAIAVFDYLGLVDKLNKVAVSPQRVDFRDFKTGQVLYSSKWGTDYEKKYGYPYWHLYRADLIAILVDALSCDIEFNASVVSYSENQNQVSVKLQDGRSFDGNLLIGADGIKSTVRTQLLGELKPRFTGNVAWRGVIPISDLPNNFMETIASNFMGQGKHMVVYYLRDKKLVNFVGVVKRKQEPEGSWVSEGTWEELNDDFGGWHPTVQTLVDAMKNKPCYRWALHNHAPFKEWSSSRVTLLGDAAHATLPFMASGAAMAIEDARILQRSLDLHDSFDQPHQSNQLNTIEAGLQCYQRNRMARTAKIQTDSTKFGKLYHVQHSLALKLAFKALDSIAKRKEDFLPSYDANVIELI